ncbi:MAG TPA: hypothetical protein V6D47_19185 [Oscillatoriaceae cyanobacterium]
MRVNSHLGPNTITVEFVDLEKAVSDFQARRQERDAALWTMGEILVRVFRAIYASETMKREFAKQGMTLRRFAREVGATPQFLTALRMTTLAFPSKERNPDLSWEHHYAIARELGHEAPAVRRRWLRDASKHEWSVPQLKRALAARKPQVPTMTAEERVTRLRRQLAEAEAELLLLRQDRTGPRRK